MSSRAEGCGQWLSSKDKRLTQLPPQKGGKGKKANQKVLLNFATSVKRSSSGLDIQVSSSPLSPETRKKLKNAKQSKINKYFESEARSNVSKCDKKLKDVWEREGCLEGKRAKIAVKRQRNENFSDIEETWRKEKENKCFTDLNISGISHLSDSFEDERIETNSPEGFVSDKNCESRNTHTSSPPHKKFRTSKNGESWTQNYPIEQSLSIESEASQPFHFSQWKKDQIAKCKEIQEEISFQDSYFTDSGGDFSQWKIYQIAKCKEIHDERSFEYSPCSDTSGDDFTQWEREQMPKCKQIEDENSVQVSPCINVRGVTGSVEEPGSTLNHRNVETEFSETPPFQFTQWANQQIEICREIQKGGTDDIHSKAVYQSHVQKGQFKSCSGEGCSEEMLKGDSEPQGIFPDWAKFLEESSTGLHEEIQEETASSVSEVRESETWDNWAENKRDSVEFITQSLHSDKSEFRFSDWVKSQMRKCRVIQEENEEDD